MGYGSVYQPGRGNKKPTKKKPTKKTMKKKK